jgi:hypothetical protein
METLVLLARDTPLPEDFDLRAALEGFPTWREPHPRAFVWLAGGSGTEVAVRDINFETKTIDDPVLSARRFLEERVAPSFPLLRAASFANGGQ